MSYQKHMIWMVLLAAILWCGGVALRWHNQIPLPVLSYGNSWPWEPLKHLDRCGEHDFMAAEPRQTAAGERYQLQVCFAPVVTTAFFHSDGNGHITSLPIDHPYTYPLPDTNGEENGLVPPEDERLLHYATETLRAVHPGVGDEAHLHDGTASTEDMLRAESLKLMAGGLATLVVTAGLIGRLTRR